MPPPLLWRPTSEVIRNNMERSLELARSSPAPSSPGKSEYCSPTYLRLSSTATDILVDEMKAALDKCG